MYFFLEIVVFSTFFANFVLSDSAKFGVWWRLCLSFTKIVLTEVKILTELAIFCFFKSQNFEINRKKSLKLWVSHKTDKSCWDKNSIWVRCSKPKRNLKLEIALTNTCFFGHFEKTQYAWFFLEKGKNDLVFFAT